MKNNKFPLLSRRRGGINEPNSVTGALMGAWNLSSTPENGGTDAHFGRTLGDGQGEIAAHAHG